MKLDLEMKIFKALGHPVRLSIIKKLVEGEKCVCKLVDSSEFSQANLSQHLKVLSNAGLINKRKDGNFSLYSISDEKVKDLVKLCEEITSNYIKKLI